MNNFKINNNNLPKGWRRVKLGEVVDFIKGKKPAKIYYKKTSNDLLEYILLGNEKIYALYEKGLVEVEPTDIIIVADGASSGSVLTGKKGILGSTFLRLRLKKTLERIFHYKFLYYFLKYSENQFKSVLTGSAIPHVDQENLKLFDIIFPQDVNEQRRIAEILSDFDDKIELNNKINKTLEEMASAIFKEWFVKNLKFKNQNAKVLKAESVFIFEKGIEPGSRYYSEVKKDNYVPFYRVRDLDKEGETDVYIPIEITKGKLCKKDDVLLSLDATVGRVKVGCSGAFSSGIRKVYSRDGIIRNSFIYFWLKTPYVQNTILEHASGTTILHAGNSIKYLEFPFEKNIIGKIQVIVEPIFNKILELKVENRKLAALRDLLLPKLMSGEILINS